MKFYAIAYQFEEDSFYDLSTEEETLSLKETCFLPTKELAQQIIDEELSIRYVPVEIKLISLQENGIWTYERGRVDVWDSECDE
ncbi:hypothetical protein P4I85_14015 [Bacillus cereus]|uniref:hypothetical protein n=1 Tax=Bacillus thuringiensis TaxID=1428 RepID=UPI001298900C|nr:hypothetical protein [Bacillus thuringiensis]MEB9509512.1 hypothetical protein [Bacillus cereus]MDR5047801.1 hypothetical protein [Bacillus thuringiensis]MEB9561606.1 hypothetical protein [Bacillus cereus]MRC02927.1 hypothetical protein [Bacillus thuringiensis]MRC76485.1 hypothetical protein [Bacillus thuringiensis]